MHTESITIHVPAGVTDSARLIVPGKGHAGRNGGAAGDLHLSVEVEAHSQFTRRGDDLHLGPTVVVPFELHYNAVPQLTRPSGLHDNFAGFEFSTGVGWLFGRGRS